MKEKSCKDTEEENWCQIYVVPNCSVLNIIYKNSYVYAE